MPSERHGHGLAILIVPSFFSNISEHYHFFKIWNTRLMEHPEGIKILGPLLAAVCNNVVMVSA